MTYDLPQGMKSTPRWNQHFGALLRRPAIATVLASAGSIPCHLVGGVLRDWLLRAPFRDLDVIVENNGEEIAKRIASKLEARLVTLGGDRFAAYRIVSAELVLDLWDRENQSLAADLERRDFTVNSFALDLASRRLLDPHSGLEDLAERRLRATSERSFTSDPLRVLRLARFGGQLEGFTVVPGTLELARSALPLLETVAPERVREELRLLFSHGGFAASFRLLEELAAYPNLWIGFSPTPSAWPSARAALDRFHRLSRRYSELAAEVTPPPEPFSGRMAVLFEAAGRAHHREAAVLLEEFKTAGYVSKRDAQRISRLLNWSQIPLDKAKQRWLLHESGQLWPTLACYLGSLGDEPMDEPEWSRIVTDLVELASRHGGEIFDPPPLLSGTDIRRLLRIPAGPRLGEIAKRLRRLQIEGSVASRSAAEKAVLAWDSGSEDASSDG